MYDLLVEAVRGHDLPALRVHYTRVQAVLVNGIQIDDNNMSILCQNIIILCQKCLLAGIFGTYLFVRVTLVHDLLVRAVKVRDLSKDRIIK